MDPGISDGFEEASITAVVKVNGLPFDRVKTSVEIYNDLYASEPIVTNNGDGTYDFDTELYHFDVNGKTPVPIKAQKIHMLGANLGATANGNPVGRGERYTGPLTVSGIEVGNPWTLSYEAIYELEDGRESEYNSSHAICFMSNSLNIQPTIWDPIQVVCGMVQ